MDDMITMDDIEAMERRKLLVSAVSDLFDNMKEELIDLTNTTFKYFGKSRRLISECVNKISRIHVIDRACIKPISRLRLPNVIKMVRAMKMKRKYYKELENEADDHEDSGVAKKKGKKLKKNKKRKEKPHVHKAEIKIGKYAINFIMVTKVKVTDE